MEHPEVIDPHDPLVERIRSMCLDFPEAVEKQSFGRPTFRAGKKVFIWMSASMDRPFSIVFKPEADERLAHLEDERFFVPPYWGPAGWLAIDFDAPDTDWVELAELIDTSYRQVALKRQLTALDAGPRSSSAGPASALPASALPSSARSASALPSSARSASALPSSARSASALPSSARSASALPASARSASALPASARSASALPSSARSASALPSSARSASALPSSALPASALPSSARSASAARPELPLVEPASRAELRAWLAENHQTSRGIRLAIGKKGNTVTTLVYEEVVLEALCFGWIDGTAGTVDADRYSVRLTPRKPGSGWAATNKARVILLTEAGLLEPAGIAAIESAQADGSWTLLDDSEAMIMPDDLAAALAAVPGAEVGYSALTDSVRKFVLAGIATAKRPATRAARIARLVDEVAPKGD